jgi:hypothetical protein
LSGDRVRVAISGCAILIDIIGNFVIATAGCIELLNHKTVPHYGIIN